MTSDSPRRVAVLGCTGSIGRQAIEVAQAHPDLLTVVALAAGSDEAALRRLGEELDVDHAGLGADDAAALARLDEVDVVLNAIVGASGLSASVAALESGKLLALANKESLVAGGELCLAAASRGGGHIVPVDSEHAALAQCLQGVKPASIDRVVVTASGGPFRERRDLATVTKQEALRHPTWSMGPKITIDSATMMNKGLELIEAHFLFGLAYDRIEVVVHKESIVHGIVRLVDGTLLMQAAATDMRIPIQAALLHPQRLQSPAPSVDLTEVESLHFEPLDVERFPLVALAYEAGRRASGFPAVLNAANEEAVRAFLGDRVSFTDIYRIVETTMSAHRPASIDGLEELLEIDGWARDHARGVIESGPRRGPRRLVGSRGGRS